MRLASQNRARNLLSGYTALPFRGESNPNGDQGVQTIDRLIQGRKLSSQESRNQRHSAQQRRQQSRLTSPASQRRTTKHGEPDKTDSATRDARGREIQRRPEVARQGENREVQRRPMSKTRKTLNRMKMTEIKP
ncbi:hypothetical protein U1Q18_043961 [Sarracenia purpurea var. burkii]